MTKEKQPPTSATPPAGKGFPGELTTKDLGNMQRQYANLLLLPSIFFLVLAALAIGTMGMYLPQTSVTPTPAPSSTSKPTSIRPSRTPTLTATMTPTEATLPPTLALIPTNTPDLTLDADKDGLTDVLEEQLGTDPKVSNQRKVQEKANLYALEDPNGKDAAATIIDGQGYVFAIPRVGHDKNQLVRVLIDGQVDLADCIPGSMIQLTAGTLIAVESGPKFSVQTYFPLQATALEQFGQDVCKVRLDMLISPTQLQPVMATQD